MQYNWPLIGHTHIKRYFEKVLQSGNIHHAYLFEGPQHLGKSTFARLLIQTLLCEEKDRQLPCGICRPCDAFKHTAHPDFFELKREEEAHISIEKTREFISTLQTRALLGSLKIGMIEEAELLTQEAANALLKTLEDAPRSVILFLIASEPLLPTISSRCQKITFHFVGSHDMEQAFQRERKQSELLRLASGRPGVALRMKESAAQESYMGEMQEIRRLLKIDEGERLLWITEQFGSGNKISDRRVHAKEIFDMLEMTLRELLIVEPTLKAEPVISMLKRTAQAKQFLKANVDPRLICEYLLLDAS